MARKPRPAVFPIPADEIGEWDLVELRQPDYEFMCKQIEPEDLSIPLLQENAQLYLELKDRDILERRAHRKSLGQSNRGREQKAQRVAELERATLAKLVKKKGSHFEKKSALAKAKEIHNALKDQGLKPRHIDTIRKALTQK
jgi:hypothetical protein